VVGIDGSPAARAALRWAVRTAARCGASVEAVSTFPLDGNRDDASRDAGRTEDLRRAGEARARETVAQVRRDPDVRAVDGAEDVEVRVTVLPGAAAEQLLARARNADLLVVGRRGRGAVRGARLGAVSLRCVLRADCPVVVVGPARTPSVRAAPPTVVVGMDGSAAARAALQVAAREAQRRGAYLAVVAAVEPIDPSSGEPVGEARLSEQHRRAWSQLIPSVSELLEGVGAALARPVQVVVVEGHPAEVLVRWSERAELLVVGNRGQGTLPGIALGPVALQTLIAATCPVMVVHPPGVPVTPADRRATPVMPTPRAGPRSRELGTSARSAGVTPARTVSPVPDG
jgi:nucleotide-binding universal stress UspA family protein